jgi:vitamin B12/bleomycin/antimicrobial peptide transport system ATP-binding/permease protein
VIGRWRDLCFQIMRTTLVSHGNTLAAPVIAWVLCAPKYLTGTMSLGEVAQSVAAFVMVQSSLNWLVDNYPGLAECLSSVNRVGSLLVALDEIDHDSSPSDGGYISSDLAQQRSAMIAETPNALPVALSGSQT